MIKKLIKYAVDPGYRFRRNAARGHYDEMPDEEFLKRMYKAKTGRTLHLDDPKTFNEKLQWLKIHDRNPAYVEMVDKLAVKDYIKNKIGSQYVIPTLGVWDCFEQIDFAHLPNQFVLKCNHDSGHVAICKDKASFNMTKAQKELNYSLSHNYYYRYREWPYKNVPPRIFAEQYMEDQSGQELRDYKVLCFHGEPKLIELHQGRFSDHPTQDFYDVDWNKLPISQSGNPQYKVTQDVYPRPSVLEEMLRLSKVLSQGIPHIRVDWYDIKDQLYFGELTLYDGSGFVLFDNPEDDLMLGSWIQLPD